jgi:hypothetical protein
MKKLLFILLFLPYLANCQARIDWFENFNLNLYPMSRNLNYHSSIQPRLFERAYVVDLSNPSPDSLFIPEKIDGNIQMKGVQLLKFKPAKRFELLPLADFGARFEKTTQYRAMAGLGIVANLGEKWYARMTYLHGLEKASDIFQAKNSISLPIDSVVNQKIDLRGRVSYSPNKFVNLQAGWDNNFIGEGSRSMLLGDYGKPYGFAQARLNFWRIEYLMMYQFLNEKNNKNQRISKFASSHYLSYNVTKWLHLGFFESVVFQPKDTTLNRGFEVEYLNPMILFRPQEYALGSSDNTLIGIDASIKIKKFTFYGQLMMDEFNFPDIKGRTRWWANKYAIQMGLKTNFNVNRHEFFVRGEMNIVRPYTYSHLSIGQSYTNQGEVLAHPYGANFSEILAEGLWQNGRWKGQIFASYSLKGYDKNAENWGGNIFIPYVNRPVELGDFGHTIGQGKGNNALRVMLRAAYTLVPKYKLDAFVEGHYRYNTYLNEPQGQIIIGIRSQLWNDYRNL